MEEKSNSKEDNCNQWEKACDRKTVTKSGKYKPGDAVWGVALEGGGML